MPYIRIKAYPKDQATKEKVVEAINKAFVDNWGCVPEAISISIEEISPEDWVEKVENTEIIPNADKMLILNGKKKYDTLS
ncbi:MAG: tautomerase family protein [Prevotella sp.]|jgi:4-oxalocrotonate tautomerase|nr:tautomerase family protein [Prevotella sp.]